MKLKLCDQLVFSRTLCVGKHKRTALYSPLQVLVQFEKRYQGSHGVDYEGYYYTLHGHKRITGTYFDGSDTFEMYYEEVNHQTNTHCNALRVASQKYFKVYMFGLIIQAPFSAML